MKILKKNCNKLKYGSGDRETSNNKTFDVTVLFVTCSERKDYS